MLLYPTACYGPTIILVNTLVDVLITKTDKLLHLESR